jgi:intracellular multiplication protein IcmX
MKKGLNPTIIKVSLLSLMWLSSSSTLAAAAAPNMNDVPQYLYYLGGYMGYDLSSAPSSPPNPFVDKVATVTKYGQMVVSLYLGAIITKYVVDNPPTSAPPYSVLNNLVDKVFVNSSPSAAGGQGSAGQGNAGLSLYNILIDQPPYQNNPISQIVFNSLMTPNFSFCGKVSKNDCPPKSGSQGLDARCCPPGLYQEQIGQALLGNVYPDSSDLYNSASMDPTLISQLNANTLIAPLLYSTQTTNAAKNRSSDVSSSLTASNQLQAAADFIRYASESLAPLPMAEEKKYSMTQKIAMGQSPGATTEQQQLAQAALSSYINGSRTRVAQQSVGVANLYEIFSKRAAQTSADNSTSSAALSEYQMATRRLFDPANQKTSWANQIDQASSVTIEKEIALLLAEINYQLYLSRQQQERILLTDTIMLFELGHLIGAPSLQMQP